MDKFLLFFLLCAACITNQVFANWTLPEQLYGSWHCGDDSCLWGVAPDLSTSGWMFDRGDGVPTFNVVILSFVNPLKLLNHVNDSATVNGMPRGMTKDVIQQFQQRNMTVILSIGGITYVNYWNTALQSDAAGLAAAAATVAQQYNVGIEIDYEGDTDADLDHLDDFVRAYRAIIPQRNPPQQPSDLLTVDTGAGNRYLTHVSMHAAAWLQKDLIDFENAMVANQPYHSGSSAEANWNEHLTGYLNVPPTPPSNLTGALWEAGRNYNCEDDGNTVVSQAIPWVQQQGMRGIFFWAAGCESPRTCLPAGGCPGVQKGSMLFLK